MKKVAILGSTGSIGTQALEVIEKHGMQVTALAANSNAEKLAEQAKKYHPEAVCIYDPSKVEQLETLLKGERTALNILQHMSGIASATNTCVRLVAGTNAKITDTRKTLPGLRRLQKYAVTVGGGFNHRYNLSEGAMLKDNHIDAYGGIVPAVTELRKKIGHMTKIEVEVRNLDELEQALSVGCEIIMLDNMSCADMAKAVEITAGRAMLEASGNVTEANIAEIAKTGVDIISLGALTHSVKCFDISMRFDK